MRHSLFTVLFLAVTGVLAGCRSLTAMWEHTTDLTVADLEALGVEAGWALSSESTIRRVLQDLDPADVDAHLRPWLCTRTGTIEGRTVAGVVSHYLLTVKGNQKTLRRTLIEASPKERPVRLRRRHLSWAAGATHRQSRQDPRPGGLPRSRPGGPGPTHQGHQEPQERRARTAALRQLLRRRALRWSTRVYSLPIDQAQSETVAAWICGHWGIENRLQVGQKRRHGRGPPLAAHRQRPRDHDHAEKPGHPASQG